MPIPNCPTCEGSGQEAIVEDSSHVSASMVVGYRSCWCSYPESLEYRAATSRANLFGVIWWMDTPSSHPLRPAVSTLFAEERLEPQELRLLKWYVGQWVSVIQDKVLKGFQGRTATIEKYEQGMEGWLERLAAVKTKQELLDYVHWLLKRGIDPF